MPQPNVIHIDQALTEFSQAFTNEEGGYVAEQMMPSIFVKKRSDKWFIYGKEHFRYRNAKRAPGALANEFDYTLSTAAYFAETRSERHLILDDNEMEQDDPLNEQIDATALLMEQMTLNREVDTAGFLANSSNLTFNTALSGTSKWDDYVNSTPLINVKTAKSSVKTNAMRRANVWLIPYDVSLVLADHPTIKDLIKYTDPKGLTESGLPPVVRGLRIVEPGAVQDTSTEGRAFTPSAIWGKNSIVAYINPGAGLKKVTLATTFVAPDPTTGIKGFATRVYREDARKGDWVETEITYTLNMVAVGAGYLYSTVIS